MTTDKEPAKTDAQGNMEDDYDYAGRGSDSPRIVSHSYLNLQPDYAYESPTKDDAGRIRSMRGAAQVAEDRSAAGQAHRDLDNFEDLNYDNMFLYSGDIALPPMSEIKSQ